MTRRKRRGVEILRKKRRNDVMEYILDGLYFVVTTNRNKTNKSDSKTEIKSNRTERYDESNCKWSSLFEIISDTEVKMTSVADPRNADIDFYLSTPNGTPTRSPLTYESILRLARKGDKIQMSGQIDHGGGLIFLTMNRIK
mgnify:CR=1 FL=1